MPSNVEIKARLEDLDTFHTLFKKVYEEQKNSCKTLEQCDTFFKCNNGRLKLREIKCQDEESVELIFYDRSDVAGPKKSDFVVYESKKDGAALKDALTRAHGKRGEVKKTRFLYIVDQTRVHIDKVEGVGAFVELEVQLKDSEKTEDGQKIANEFMEKLNITSDMLVKGSYIDLLAEDPKTDAAKNEETSEKKAEADAPKDKEKTKEVTEEPKDAEMPAAAPAEKTDAPAAATEESSEKKTEKMEDTKAEEDKKEASKAEETKDKENAAKGDAAEAKPENKTEASEQMDTEDAATEKAVEAKAGETPASEVAVDANTEA